MTVILALGNQDQIILVCDRRLTINGKLLDDEATKGGIFICSNGRFAYGFTGLARIGDFDTQNWLINSITNLGQPEFTAKPILDRLTEKATRDFSSYPVLSRACRKGIRITIMFAGYLYHHTPPLGGFAILSNFQDCNTNDDSNKAWDSFKSWFWIAEKTKAEDFTFIRCIGYLSAVNNNDIDALEVLLKHRKPAEEIVRIAVGIVRKMADRPTARGTIGKQLISIILPRDSNIPPTSEYHSKDPKPITYVAPVTVVTKKLQATVELQLTKIDNNFENIPIVGKNQRCPCGSGKRYKNCHGKSIQTKVNVSQANLNQYSQDSANIIQSYKADISKGKSSIELNVYSLQAYIETAPEVQYWIQFLRNSTRQRIEGWGDLNRDIRIAHKCGIFTIDGIKKIMIDARVWGEQFFKIYYEAFFIELTKEQVFGIGRVSTVLNGVVTWLLIASNEIKFPKKVLEKEFGIHGLGSWYITEAAKKAKSLMQ